MDVEGQETPSRYFVGQDQIALNPMLLLAEVEHRIANEFALAVSSINLIARDCAGQAKEALAHAATRLTDYAHAHRALLPPVGEGPIDLSVYLRDVCQALTRASLAERRIALSLHETSITIEIWRAWRIGLVVSELISNSVRHGVWPVAGGTIRVEIASDDFDICCRVTDNGRGFKAFSRGTGTNIVDALVVEMCGCINREFYREGVAVLLTIPRFHPASRGFNQPLG